MISRVCCRPLQRVFLICFLGALTVSFLAVLSSVNLIGMYVKPGGTTSNLKRELLIRMLVQDEIKTKPDAYKPSANDRQPKPHSDNSKGWKRGQSSQKDAEGQKHRSIPDRIKVLILGYYRSGSTLTGSIFDSHPNTFYAFEPLYPLIQKTIKFRHPLEFFNGTSVAPPTFGNMTDACIEVLRAFYTCRLENLDIRTLNKGFSHKSKSLFPYRRCVQSFSEQEDFLNITRHNCLPSLVETCEASKIIVLKEIRVSMRTAEELLLAIPDLKIVHLIRDPRGMICSKHPKICAASVHEPEPLCRAMRDDHEVKQRLQQLYPGQITDLKYEDLVLQPLKTVLKLFKFSNIPFHSNVAKWIYRTTLSGTTANGVLGTVRPNPIATAYNWTTKIKWPVANASEVFCADVFKFGGYPRFETVQQIRDYKWPTRDLEKEKIELRKYVV